MGVLSGEGEEERGGMLSVGGEEERGGELLGSTTSRRRLSSGSGLEGTGGGQGGTGGGASMFCRENT